MGWMGGGGTSLFDLIANRNRLAQNRVNGSAPTVPIPAQGTTIAGVRKPPPGSPVVGQAITREEAYRRANQPSVDPGTPNAPTLPASATSNLGSAAERMRRRAAAGSAGRVSTGPVSASQRGIRPVTAPRTLIGS
ncbi:MAG: hypothetical protein ACM3NQ_16495 [Bacteroidales bacterium]